MKDISESLNFNYEIRPPTDGNLWGEIFSNGSATGLVRDIKVRLIGYFVVKSRLYLSRFQNRYLAFADLFVILERKNTLVICNHISKPCKELSRAFCENE